MISATGKRLQLQPRTDKHAKTNDNISISEKKYQNANPPLTLTPNGNATNGSSANTTYKINGGTHLLRMQRGKHNGNTSEAIGNQRGKLHRSLFGRNGD